MQAIKCEKVRFNTQPHEGGCSLQSDSQRQEIQFQHTAARRRLQVHQIYGSNAHGVSTHSRTKAAAWSEVLFAMKVPVSTHSRTKAAARLHILLTHSFPVSTHSRTKAAALSCLFGKIEKIGFNTQPHEGGCILSDGDQSVGIVSTHSRTKGAAARLPYLMRLV